MGLEVGEVRMGPIAIALIRKRKIGKEAPHRVGSMEESHGLIMLMKESDPESWLYLVNIHVILIGGAKRRANGLYKHAISDGVFYVSNKFPRGEACDEVDGGVIGNLKSKLDRVVGIERQFNSTCSNFFLASASRNSPWKLDAQPTHFPGNGCDAHPISGNRDPRELRPWRNANSPGNAFPGEANLVFVMPIRVRK